MGDEFSIIANSAIIIEVAVNPAKVVGLHLAATIRLSTGSIAGLPRIDAELPTPRDFKGTPLTTAPSFSKAEESKRRDRLP